MGVSQGPAHGAGTDEWNWQNRPHEGRKFRPKIRPHFRPVIQSHGTGFPRGGCRWADNPTVAPRLCLVCCLRVDADPRPHVTPTPRFVGAVTRGQEKEVASETATGSTDLEEGDVSVHVRLRLTPSKHWLSPNNTYLLSSPWIFIV